MIKVKLTESRTLPVPQNLVDAVTRVYRAAYIKIVVDFINNQMSSGDLDTRLSDKYDNLLEQVQEKYSKELADAESGAVGFISDLDVDSVIQSGELVESVPVEQFITALLAWPELETYLRGRIKPAAFKTRLKRYFKNKGVDDIQFNIEFGTRGTTLKKDYAGLYESDVDAINITFNASYFLPEEEGRETGNRILSIKNIAAELEETRTSVRHELQHLFQNMMSSVLGTGDWNVGLPPRDVVGGVESGVKRHYMDPIEMQTDIQDEADKFASYVKTFKEKNANLSAIFPQATKILLKLFVDSKLTTEEQAFAKQHKLNNYIISSDLLNDMKLKDKSGKLYKYALTTLYTSISDQLQENLVMDNIKIILTESQVSKEYTKEEIRKIIRDEFEKLLRDKENRKEISKITKEFVKKFYRELSQNSTYVVDRIDV